MYLNFKLMNLPVCSILLPPFGRYPRPCAFVNDVKLKYAKNWDLDVSSSILKHNENYIIMWYIN